MKEDFSDLLHRICDERKLKIADIAKLCKVKYQTAYCWMRPTLPSLPGDETACHLLSQFSGIPFRQVLAAVAVSKEKTVCSRQDVEQRSEEAQLVEMLRVTGFAERCPCRAAKFTSFAALKKVCAPKIAKGMVFCKKCPVTGQTASLPDYVQIVPLDKFQAGSYK